MAKAPPYDLLVAHALVRGLKPADLSPGDYPLNGTAQFQFNCSLTKGVQTSARVPLRPAWGRVLGRLLKRLKVAPERVATTLTRALHEAEASAELDPHTLAAEACLQNLAAAQPEVPREGATRFAGNVQLVEFKPD